VLDICDLLLQPLGRMEQTLSHHLRRLQMRQATLKRFGATAKWVFMVKKKILFLRAAVGVQHQLLNTVLQLMMLTATGARTEDEASKN
jgi:hypothetical protein